MLLFSVQAQVDVNPVFPSDDRSTLLLIGEIHIKPPLTSDIIGFQASQVTVVCSEVEKQLLTTPPLTPRLREGKGLVSGLPEGELLSPGSQPGACPGNHTAFQTRLCIPAGASLPTLL